MTLCAIILFFPLGLFALIHYMRALSAYGTLNMLEPQDPYDMGHISYNGHSKCAMGYIIAYDMHCRMSIFTNILRKTVVAILTQLDSKYKFRIGK